MLAKRASRTSALGRLRVFASRGWQHRGDFWGRFGSTAEARGNPRLRLSQCASAGPKINAASARSAHPEEGLSTWQR